MQTGHSSKSLSKLEQSHSLQISEKGRTVKLVDMHDMAQVADNDTARVSYHGAPVEHR